MNFLGTVRCFLFSKDKSYFPLAPHHALSNSEEEKRISDLKGITNSIYLNRPGDIINYTRCLGDFKMKLYYKEIEQFKLVTD